MSPFLISKEGRPVKRPEETRAVKAAPFPKRKRKVAGPKVAPLIATPMVPFLSDTECNHSCNGCLLDRSPNYFGVSLID